ncbi:MAG TPA: hypothetical protein VIZ28_03405 [Chitinophagaceae bacterium]
MRFISLLMIALVFFSCEKDKFTTKPQLKFKSVNSSEISGDQTIQMKFELTDKEGDFSSFLAIKKTVRGCPTSEFIDSSRLQIPPGFIDSKGSEGELVITLNRTDRGSNTCLLPGNIVRPDTTVYSFWTRDRAGNVSDTAHSTEIIILP